MLRFTASLAVALGCTLALGRLHAEVLRQDDQFAPRFEKVGGGVSRVLITPEGDYYAAGFFSGIGSAAGSNLVRFHADGTPDASFYPSRRPGTPHAIQEDGKLLVELPGAASFARVLARLEVNGRTDPGFATGREFSDVITSVAVQLDGAILVGGYFTHYGEGACPGLIRLDPNGQIDGSFVPEIGTSSRVTRVVIQPDGRLLVAGYPLNIPGKGSSVIARLLPNGALDPSFVPALPSNGAVEPEVALQADGKVLVAGGFAIDSGTRFVVRLDADGSVDNGFSDTAVATGRNLKIRCLFAEPDGAVFIVAWDYWSNSSFSLRLLSDGSLDTSFEAPEQQGDYNGLATAARFEDGRYLIGGTSRLARYTATGRVEAEYPVLVPADITAVGRHTNGSWIVAGTFEYANGAPRSGLARVNAAGLVDPSFAPDAGTAVIESILALDDGSAIVGGAFSTIGGVGRGNVARILNDGAVDPAFAAGGGFSGRVVRLARHADGRIVAAGVFSSYDGTPRAGLARLLPGGGLDSTFDPGSGLSPALPRAMALQDDGRLVIAGQFQTVAGVARRGIARLNADGSLDTSFDPGTGFSDAVNDVFVRAEGRILACGDFKSYDGAERFGLVQVNSDGSLDSSFVPDTGYYTYVAHAAVTTDGSIWVSGSIDYPGRPSGAPTASLVHLDANGSARSLPVIADVDVPRTSRALVSYAGANLLVAGVSELAEVGGFVALRPAEVPVIVQAPGAQSADPGDTVVFRVEATGPGLSFQWIKDGRDLAGETGSTLTLTNVHLKDLGTYAVRITNQYDTVVSPGAVLSGRGSAPTISAGPGTVSVVQGASVVLAVAHSVVSAPTYQWRRSGVPIPGAIGASLELAAVEFADAGFYDVVVGDGLSGTVSPSGRLIVHPQPMADVYRLGSSFGPRLETTGGFVRKMFTAPGGEVYVVGDFSGIAASTSPRLARFRSDGTVDPVFRPAVINDGEVLALAVQSDGRILIAGSFSHVGGEPRDCIARLDTDGSLDPTFSTGEGFTPQFSIDDPKITSLAVQPDGAIVIGGYFWSYRGVERHHLARLLADGTLDGSFVPGSEVDGQISALALQADGRVVVSGAFGYYAPNGRHFARLASNGSLDATFDSGSYVSRPVDVIAIQDDGKILIGGRFEGAFGEDIPKGIGRLNTDGSKDAGFASAMNGAGAVSAIAIEPGGSILVSGRIYLNDLSRWSLLARVSASGVLESSLMDAPYEGPEMQAAAMARHTSGEVLVSVGRTEYANAIVEQRLERITAAGGRDAAFSVPVRCGAAVYAIESMSGGRWAVGGDFTFVDGEALAGLVVLRADGSRDPNFAPMAGFDGPVVALSIDGAGRIVAGGGFSLFDGRPARGIIRLLDTGVADVEFDAGAGFVGSPGVPGLGVRDLTVLPDGKILAGGAFSSFNGVEAGRLARLRDDGTLDAAFSIGDWSSSGVNATGAEPDGRIIVAGAFATVGSVAQTGLARLNTEGALDATFQTNGILYSASDFVQLADGSVIAGDGSTIRRFLASGAHDPGYRPEGSVPVRMGSLQRLAADSEGRCWLAGYPDESGRVIERLDAHGAVDAAFRIAGTLPLRDGSVLRAVHFAPGGTLLLGGDNLSYGGARASGLIRLERAPVPVVTAQPLNVTAQPGDSVQFSVTVQGEGLSYQWYHNGIVVPGATSATLSLANVGASDAGSYHVVITNSWGTVTSGPATLLGPNPVPIITQQPESIIAVAGTTASLSVTAGASGTLTYQWRKFGQPIPGATASVLTLTPVEAAHEGFYDVVVANGLSTTESVDVQVTIAPPVYPNRLRPSATFAPVIEQAGSFIEHMLALPDGKLLASGYLVRVGDTRQPGLARFNPDGSLDSGIRWPMTSGEVRAMALQPDGKLLLAGTFDIPGESARRQLLRLNLDGSLDSSFVAAGPFSSSIDTIAVQADGRILVGGTFTAIDTMPAGRIARLNADGTLDATFSTGEGFSGGVFEIALQSTGRILVLGGFGYYNGELVPQLVRLLADGTLDTTFSAADGNVATFLVLPDDRLLLGRGVSSSFGSLRRLGADGALDADFASVFASDSMLQVTGMSRQTDGGVVVVAHAWPPSGAVQVSEVARFLADGSRDANFAHTVARGRFNCVATSGDDRAYIGLSMGLFDGQLVREIIQLGSDGKLLPYEIPELYAAGTVLSVAPATGGGWWVGGAFNRVNGSTTGNIARLTSAGALDPSFSMDPSVGGYVHQLAETGDGGLWVAGNLFVGTAPDAPRGFIRVTASGALAPFAADLPAGSVCHRFTRLPDGSIVVLGYAGESSDPVTARVRGDGSIDSSFAHDLNAWSASSQVAAAVDGSVYLAGSNYFLERGELNVVRIAPSGGVDPGFFPGEINSSSVTAIQLLPDGRLVVGGVFPGGEFPLQFRNLARLLPDGARDPAFVLEAPFESIVQVIVPQADGKVIASGYPIRLGDSQPETVVRFDAFGRRDAAFVMEGVDFGSTFSSIVFTAQGGLLCAGHVLGATGSLVMFEPVPEITHQPGAVAPRVAGGEPIEFSVDVDGVAGATYQWQVRYDAPGALALGAADADGFVDIPGAQGRLLEIPSPQLFHNGRYRVVVTSGSVSTVSDAITISVDDGAPSDARLMNLSTRGLAQGGDGILIPGFVIAGNGTKRLLIRGVGPSLSQFGVGDALADPVIRLMRAGTALATNDDWSVSADADEVAAVAARVGAFALDRGSKDAALLVSLPAGAYTVPAGGADDGVGTGMVEVYDADEVATGATLVNISNRGYVGVGGNIMIPGFVVSNEGSRTVLLRAVGPSLAGLGVSGVLSDPVLYVFRRGSMILSCDDWQSAPGASRTASVSRLVGAFDLEEGSTDAAFVVTLPPGAYTVHAAGKNGGVGIALVEVYLVP